MLPHVTRRSRIWTYRAQVLRSSPRHAPSRAGSLIGLASTAARDGRDACPNREPPSRRSREGQLPTPSGWRHRARAGSCWHKPNGGQQAALILVHLRKGEAFSELAAGYTLVAAHMERAPAPFKEMCSRD